ncbi:MAG: HAD-IC family P-type ATPase, partial [Myxococcota bacterium]|nr:HAD-IC family P-type ATPase [Myxococcota bacterium]
MSAWHSKTSEEVLREVGVDPATGLEERDAKQRLEREGPNRLTARRGKSALRRFLAQLTEPLVAILIVAAIVSAALGDVPDTIVITIVVLVNALIGFFQEQRAENAIAALDQLVTTEATVLRGGEKRRAPSADLVVGDIVFLQSGDGVPADLRLLELRDLQIEEATLTGESVPSVKGTGVLAPDTSMGDRENVAFAGTAVTYGTGCGVVVATGDATETGRIAGLIASAEEIATPLTRRIAGLSQLLVWIILGVSVLLFAVETLRGAAFEHTFNAVVAFAVGAIPEGLPAAVTVLLAVGVSQMAKRRALIRKLPAVETLGSTTVICSDKTGTLTENQMTVRRVWTVGIDVVVTGVGYDAPGAIERDGRAIEPSADPALLECIRAGALCNDTRIARGEDGTKIEGDPTEAALLVLASKAKLSESLARAARRDAIPFESQHMYMATLHPPANDGGGASDGSVLYVKGSSEVVISRCIDALAATGGNVPLDHDAVCRRVDELAAGGLRVLCLARRTLPADASDIDHDDVRDLTLLGIVGMIDPPRDRAKHAIAACHRAGVHVKMITGDHAITASAIAAELGLEGERDAAGKLRALTGTEIERLAPEELSELAERVAVFARVAPEQKLTLVRALQKRGHVVAMTGDGVNDAPALKQADIGVAMGRGGTDVARGASAMILTDDDFATIEAAIEEGRGVYENLVKFIAWSLPINGGQGLVLLAAIAIGAVLPILPVQILWINMATAILLGTALVFEPKEPGLMTRPPRPAKAPLLDGRAWLRILVVSALIAGAAFGFFEWALAVDPENVAVARTIAGNTIVVVEIGYLFACRSLHLPVWRLGVFSNRWVWIGTAVMLGAQLLYTYVPFMNAVFRTAPIDAIWWLYMSGAGLAVFAAVELKKVLFGRRNAGPEDAARAGGRAGPTSDPSAPAVA